MLHPLIIVLYDISSGLTLSSFFISVNISTDLFMFFVATHASNKQFYNTSSGLNPSSLITLNNSITLLKYY
jgi:hypothetical protein